MNNQISNGSFSTSNEGIQRMIEMSTAMHRSIQMVIAQSTLYLPVNTIKAYSARQEEWKSSIIAYAKDKLKASILSTMKANLF